MKMPKLVLAGYFLGLIVVVSSIIRYQFVFDDVFKLLVGLALGGLVLLFAYLYSWMRLTDKKLDKLEDRTDAIVAWWTKGEKDDVRNRARGLEEDR